MKKEISSNDFLRFQKHFLLPEVGYAGQEKLKNAKVLVIGAGGLGCPVLQYLCTNGIGKIGIVDFDKVEIHNLHRQILYNHLDIGKPKATTAKERLTMLNPECSIEAFDEKISLENVMGLIQGFDLVVDGSDNFTTRYLVNDACVQLSKPLVYGSILGFQGQLAVFNHRASKNLRDIFPEAPDPKHVPNCEENGVLGTLPGIIGLMMAQEVLKVILNLTPLHNQWLIFNSLGHELKKLNF